MSLPCSEDGEDGRAGMVFVDEGEITDVIDSVVTRRVNGTYLRVTR